MDVLHPRIFRLDRSSMFIISIIQKVDASWPCVSIGTRSGQDLGHLIFFCDPGITAGRYRTTEIVSMRCWPGLSHQLSYNSRVAYCLCRLSRPVPFSLVGTMVGVGGSRGYAVSEIPRMLAEPFQDA